MRYITTELDVRQEIPARRHQLIFETWNGPETWRIKISRVAA